MKKKQSARTLIFVLLSCVVSTCSAWHLPKNLFEHTTPPDYIFWEHLRQSFKLDHCPYKPRVANQIAWFQNHQDTLQDMLINAGPYMYFIYQQVQERNLPGEIVLLPVIESAYNPFAHSHAGAAGLWQLMPRTAHGYGIKRNGWFDGRRDIHDSTGAALTHLAYLEQKFNNNWLFAFAAYDAGAGRVHSALNSKYVYQTSTRFWSLPLPQETQIYVPRLLALAEIIEHPKRYGIKLPPIKDQPYFDVVEVRSAIDLRQAAQYANVSLKEIYRLNPGYKRFLPEPNKKCPCHLVLPVEKIEQFKARIEHLRKIHHSKPKQLVAVQHKT